MATITEGDDDNDDKDKKNDGESLDPISTTLTAISWIGKIIAEVFR